MWLRWLDRQHQIYYAPAQWEWVREQTDLSEEACIEAAWVVLPTGEKYSGAAAISVTFDTLFYTGQLFYKIYSLPLLQQFYDYGYSWIAKNRGNFSRLLNFFLNLSGRKVIAAIRQDPPWDPL